MISTRFNNLLIEVKQEMNWLKIPYSEDITEIKVNSRATKFFGICRIRDNKFSIELVKRMLETDDKSIKNVIAHELIHTVKDCFNHGSVFMRYANMMNRAYGYNIKTGSTSEEYGLDMVKAKYIIKCQTCGTESRYQKKTRIFNQLSLCECTKCKDSNFKIITNY